MTDENIQLSRRHVLAGLGATGLASAGAGLGTSALFSDEESFTGNTLAAGTLDLKVDWEEHYYDGLDGLDDLDLQLVSDGVPDGYVGFPSADPTVAVAEGDVSAFMDATAVEAYPDPTGDGVQDAFATEPGGTTENGVGYVCEDGADTADDLDPRGGLRTENADTLVETDDGQEPAPLFDLGDVKPGDFGEATLSFHLCDNPGYVWLQGGLIDASENGLTEPEQAADDDEGGEGELLDEIQTTVWYDEDGDNILDSGGEDQVSGEEVDVMIVLDRSGSMTNGSGKFQSAKDGATALVNALGQGTQVGLVSFASSPTLDQPLTSNKSAVTSAIGGLNSNGGTNLSSAVDAGREELTGDDVSSITASGNDRDNARKVMVFLTNGSDSDETGALNAADEVKTIGDLYTIAYGSGANTTLLENMASAPASDYFFDAPSQSEVGDAFDDIGEQIVVSGGEEVIFSGTLRETLSELSAGDGIALDAAPDDEERGCYAASSTHYVGFEWRLPLSVGNVVQSDTASFDLGFYAEQCRNNDGT